VKLLRFLAIPVLGGLLFGSAIAFAAAFDLNGNPGQAGQQDISSGEAMVGSCNGNVEININGDWVDGSSWIVGDVEIDANPVCAGYEVSVVLTDGSGNGLAEESGTLDAGGDATLDFTSHAIDVADVEDVHVLIDPEPGSILP
jgi:hypothetical protein